MSGHQGPAGDHGSPVEWVGPVISETSGRPADLGRPPRRLGPAEAARIRALFAPVAEMAKSVRDIYVAIREAFGPTLAETMRLGVGGQGGTEGDAHLGPIAVEATRLAADLDREQAAIDAVIAQLEDMQACDLEATRLGTITRKVEASTAGPERIQAQLQRLLERIAECQGPSLP